MRPQVVVLMTPVIDEQTGFLEGAEPVLVKAVIAEGAVEGLDEGVLDGLAGLDVVEVNLAPLSPEVKRLARELRAVVTGDGTRGSHRVTECIEQIGHNGSPDGGIHMESQTLAGAVVHQSQATEAPPSGKLVMDEVHGPAFIGTHGSWQGSPNQGRQLPALPPAQGEPFLAVNPGRALTVDDHPFGFEDVMKDGKPPPGLPICPVTHAIPESTIRAFHGTILHGGAVPSGDPAKTTLGEPKAAGDLTHGTSASFGL
jgi:hypothetical protein